MSPTKYYEFACEVSHWLLTHCKCLEKGHWATVKMIRGDALSNLARSATWQRRYDRAMGYLNDDRKLRYEWYYRERFTRLLKYIAKHIGAIQPECDRATNGSGRITRYYFKLVGPRCIR